MFVAEYYIGLNCGEQSKLAILVRNRERCPSHNMQYAMMHNTDPSHKLFFKCFHLRYMSVSMKRSYETDKQSERLPGISYSRRH